MGLNDLWRYRELLYFLAWRDLKVRYTQAVIGSAWALLQPLLMMTVFTAFLGRVAELQSRGVPYALFSLSGLAVWTYFSNAVGGATQSLVSSSNLVSKVYFPRLVIPLAALLSWVPDLLIATLLVLVVMVTYGIEPEWPIIVLPVVLSYAVLVSASVSIWLAALNVAYRDVRYAVPFLLQVWLFATPIVYPLELLPPRWRVLAGANPVSGVVEVYRWSTIHESAPSWSLITVSGIVSTILLIGGAYYFRRLEHGFADVI